MKLLHMGPELKQEPHNAVLNVFVCDSYVHVCTIPYSIALEQSRIFRHGHDWISNGFSAIWISLLEIPDKSKLEQVLKTLQDQLKP